MISLPFRQLYFSADHVANSNLLPAPTHVLMPHVETWIYETLMVDDTVVAELQVKSRYFGEPFDRVNHVLGGYMPFNAENNGWLWAAFLCAYDTIYANRGWAMDDNKLRLYHAVYHDYREGVELGKDGCVARAMKEMQLTSSLGVTRHQVPDDYHELFIPLSQAIPLRLWYKQKADDLIEEQCAMTHNHSDYLFMAREYTKMLDPRYQVQVPENKVGLRWDKFRSLVSRDETSEFPEVRQLLQFLVPNEMGKTMEAQKVKRRKGDPTRNVIAGNNNNRGPLIEIVLSWDEQDHIWLVGQGRGDLVVAVSEDSRNRELQVKSIMNRNLEHMMVMPGMTYDISFFKGRHKRVSRDLVDTHYSTGRTQVMQGLTFHEWSLSKMRLRCGRYLIMVIQEVLGVKRSTVAELDVIPGQMSRDYEDLEELFLQEDGGAYVNNIRKGYMNVKKSDMLWSPYDLKMVLNHLGIEVGIVFHAPNIQQGRLGKFAVYNFDKYYRPREYSRYIFGVIHSNHWYFYTLNDSMFFTKELLLLLPREHTDFFSFGREMIMWHYMTERGA
jgi:hypothetical protein